MNPNGKTVFLFVFLFIFPFSAHFSAEPLDEEYRNSTEYLLSEEFLRSDEFLQSDEYLLFDDSPFTEEYFFDEDEIPLLSEEPFSDEDFFPDEEDFLFEAPTLIIEAPHFLFEPRSFDALFPGFSPAQKALVYSKQGLKRSYKNDSSPMLIPNPDSGINIMSSVMEKAPSHIIEAIVVVPYNERELEMLDVYNALGRIENIKDHSIPVNGRDFYIFTETTRLISDKNRRPVPDPPPVDMLPYAETMYLRFREVHMGNLFLRGEISMSLYGITYSITNFTDIRFLLLPVMRAERFSVILYLEPIKEGVLVYCMSGLYLPGFIADRVNLTGNINNRITVLLSWITEGLRIQGSLPGEARGAN
ncbi:MAG: hypothetical protein LBH42_08930 [Treponema sp.]|nr:hypothetical protein [Treponema sp.]